MKRPSFQFYPADWLRDTALRSCSMGARGLWIDMICYMHEGNPYGHLKVGNKVILPTNLASMAGSALQDVNGWLDELGQSGVFDLLPDGTIFSKRMVRDESLREIRAAGGKLGGNPALKVNLEDNPKVENEVKQKPTPSSSSSSSSSLTSVDTNICPPDGGPEVKIPDCDHQGVKDLYHLHLPTLRKVEVWNAARQGYLRQRWREVATELAQAKPIDGKDVLAWWAQFFRHISQSKFLVGKVNNKDGRAFTADLEWILKPSNFAKIVEGKYHGAN